jgi:hypothetical protein
MYIFASVSHEHVGRDGLQDGEGFSIELKPSEFMEGDHHRDALRRRIA